MDECNDTRAPLWYRVTFCNHERLFFLLKKYRFVWIFWSMDHGPLVDDEDAELIDEDDEDEDEDDEDEDEDDDDDELELDDDVLSTLTKQTSISW